MKVIENELIVMFDCDDTLCLWSSKNKIPHEGAIRFVDPNDGAVHYLTPHDIHIDLLKKYKGRGYFIVVWSASGYAWAKTVVETLKIQDYVDLVMSKSIKYVDDLHADEILGTRVYLPFKKD